MRYHVNPQGEVRICRAEVGSCRYGEDTIHGDNFDEVQKQYEDSMKDSLIPDVKDSKQSEEFDEAPQSRVFNLTAGSYNTFKKSTEKANRRLEKAGVTERFSYTVEEKNVQVANDFGVPFSEKRYFVSLNKPMIGHEDYKFLAVVSKEGNSFITKSARDVELGGWKPDNTECEHCGIKRARSKMYIIEGPDGKKHQIGSSCVKAFLGIQPEGLWALEYEPSIADEEALKFGVSSSSYQVPVDYILAVASVVSEDGKYFVPNSSYDKRPTNSLVNDVLHGGVGVDENWRSEMFEKIDNLLDSGKIKEMKEFISEHSDVNTDYGSNIKALVSQEWNSGKTQALLVSSVAMRQREERRKALEEEKKKKFGTFTAGHYGVVGEKIPKGSKFTVVNTSPYTSQGYGYYASDIHGTRLTLKDSEGHQIVWFSTTQIDVEDDSEITVSSGSIKKHGDYNGVDQTIISRVRLLK